MINSKKYAVSQHSPFKGLGGGIAAAIIIRVNLVT